jgi:DNA-binding MarR family transcriptional regulator
MNIKRSEILDSVSEELFSIPPLIFRATHKRLARPSQSGQDVYITPHQLEIVRLLAVRGTMHASEIGEQLQIAKAQMTNLIDRLVAMDIVERKNDTEDRRVYNVSLTEQGKNTLRENRKKIVIALRDIIGSLSDEELESLSHSLRSLRDILLKNSS